jgi:chromosome segregation ATPase
MRRAAKRVRLGVLVPICAALLCQPLAAWSQDSPEVARMKQLLRQLQTENRTLTADKVRMQGEIDATKKDLENSKAEIKQLEKDLRQEQARAQRLGENLEQTEGQRDEAYDRIRQQNELIAETTHTLQSTIVERNDLQARGEALGQEMDSCEEKNKALYDMAEELSHYYEKTGGWESVNGFESFFQLKRVEVENVLEEYRYKLGDQRHYRDERPR